MSKRLQVLVDEAEYRRFSKQARTEGVSLGEWVRQSLRSSLKLVAGRSPEEKMGRIRALAQKGAYPTSDIDSMLREIEQGYLDDIH